MRKAVKEATRRDDGVLGRGRQQLSEFEMGPHNVPNPTTPFVAVLLLGCVMLVGKEDQQLTAADICHAGLVQLWLNRRCATLRVASG